jgi:hypothetical protein
MKLDADDRNWKIKAKALMRDQKTFILEGWDPVFVPDDEVKALLIEFGYKRKIQPGLSQLIFEPRISN